MLQSPQLASLFLQEFSSQQHMHQLVCYMHDKYIQHIVQGLQGNQATIGDLIFHWKHAQQQFLSTHNTEVNQLLLQNEALTNQITTFNQQQAAQPNPIEQLETLRLENERLATQLEETRTLQALQLQQQLATAPSQLPNPVPSQQIAQTSLPPTQISAPCPLQSRVAANQNLLAASAGVPDNSLLTTGQQQPPQFQQPLNQQQHLLPQHQHQPQNQSSILPQNHVLQQNIGHVSANAVGGVSHMNGAVGMLLGQNSQELDGLQQLQAANSLLAQSQQQPTHGTQNLQTQNVAQVPAAQSSQTMNVQGNVQTANLPSPNIHTLSMPVNPTVQVIQDYGLPRNLLSKYGIQLNPNAAPVEGLPPVNSTAQTLSTNTSLQIPTTVDQLSTMQMDTDVETDRPTPLQLSNTSPQPPLNPVSNHKLMPRLHMSSEQPQALAPLNRVERRLSGELTYGSESMMGDGATSEEEYAGKLRIDDDLPSPKKAPLLPLKKRLSSAPTKSFVAGLGAPPSFEKVALKPDSAERKRQNQESGDNEPIDDRHTCPVCQKKVKYLQPHLAAHTGASYKECPICHKLVSRLSDHMSVHTDHRPFKCDFCPKAFKIKKRLRDHVTLQHSNENFYKCALCDKGFKKLHQLRKHESDPEAHPGTDLPTLQNQFKLQSQKSKLDSIKLPPPASYLNSSTSRSIAVTSTVTSTSKTPTLQTTSINQPKFDPE